MTLHPEQSCLENLKNAAAIAQAWSEPAVGGEPEITDAFASILRLIRQSLEQLSEPNDFALLAAEPFLPRRLVDPHRHARDLAAVILNAQVRGAL